MKTPLLDWIVIGAGPAGMAAVGKLIDQGISPNRIGWIDPYFRVGDLGGKWNQVPSNTKVSLFLRFMEECKAFDFKTRPSPFPIESFDPQENCQLSHVVEPLQWITDGLKHKVVSYQSTAIGLSRGENQWEIKTKEGAHFSRNVILAIGSEPKTLSYPLETISLETALDPLKLAKSLHPKDTIAVFGSSHSAILALANLERLEAKQVVHFYRSPHRYALYLDDWILFDDSGLKGFTAQWAKEHIDGRFPINWKRIPLFDPSFEEALSRCNKAIYAVGFERRKMEIKEVSKSLHYDDKTGLIAPGLFGLGIAFPQAKQDRLGHLEFRVGLWKFMDYLNSILPLWIQFSENTFPKELDGVGYDPLPFRSHEQ